MGGWLCFFKPKNGGFQVPTALRQIEHWLSYLTDI
jgi:hypothetical protein